MAATELHLIALKLVRYNDRQSILTAYSLEAGCVALAVPAGAGRSAARTRALTMPLSLLSAMADLKSSREIPPLRNPMPSPALHSLHSSPVKQMVAMFLAELLAVILRDGQPDSALFRFLASAIMVLDAASEKETANFHLAFLCNLARHIGIEPDISTYRYGRLLDLRDGQWRDSAPVAHHDFLDTAESATAAMLSRMTMENMGKYKFSRNQRNRALDVMISYYSMHYVSLRRLRSREILRTL